MEVTIQSRTNIIALQQCISHQFGTSVGLCYCVSDVFLHTSKLSRALHRTQIFGGTVPLIKPPILL